MQANYFGIPTILNIIIKIHSSAVKHPQTLGLLGRNNRDNFRFNHYD
jgi:hypothetical protein